MSFNLTDLWITDEVVAYVDNGVVTLQIAKPTRSLPKKLAYDVADKIWYANQMRELEIARQQCETKTIPLTDRRRRSSLRLGGGFMITQGTKLIFARRTMTASRRPGQFCESGGVFEVVDTDKDHIGNDFIASLLKESLEIIFKKNNRIYMPQLSSITRNLIPDKPELLVYFQPPDISLDKYNKVIEEELKKECARAKIPGYNPSNLARFHMTILNYERSVKLQYGYSPEISVEITAEIDSSSLECVGVLSLPEDIDLAAVSFLEEDRKIKQQKFTDAEQTLLKNLQKEVAEVQKLENPANPYNAHELWDTECIQVGLEIINEEVAQRTPNVKLTGHDLIKYEKDPEQKNKWYFPLDREIHMIDFMDRKDVFWMLDPDFRSYNDPTSRKRIAQSSNLGKELSKVRLRATGGNFATEKLNLAIKMHCPLPQLEPLIVL